MCGGGLRRRRFHQLTWFFVVDAKLICESGGKPERYTFFLRILRAYHCAVFPSHMAKLRQEHETLPVFRRPLTFDEFEAIFFQSEVTDPALLRGQAGAGDDGFPLKQARLRKAACFMLGTFADEEPFFVSQIDRNPALRELVKDLLVKASNSCQNGTLVK